MGGWVPPDPWGGFLGGWSAGNPGWVGAPPPPYGEAHPCPPPPPPPPLPNDLDSGPTRPPTPLHTHPSSLSMCLGFGGRWHQHVGPLACTRGAGGRNVQQCHMSRLGRVHTPTHTVFQLQGGTCHTRSHKIRQSIQLWLLLRTQGQQWRPVPSPHCVCAALTRGVA